MTHSRVPWSEIALLKRVIYAQLNSSDPTCLFSHSILPAWNTFPFFWDSLFPAPQKVLPECPLTLFCIHPFPGLDEELLGANPALETGSQIPG